MMETQTGDNSMKDQILRGLEDKESAELLQIWTEHDSEQWAPEAFDAIRDILARRGVALPAQVAPVVEDEEETYTDEENRLLKLVSWAEWLSYIVIGIGAIRSVLLVANNFSVLRQADWSAYVSLLLQLLEYVVRYGFIFFILKAVSEISYLLIDMQHSLQPVDPENQEEEAGHGT